MAAACQGREHDGTRVHRGQRVVDVCFNHKVGALDANGRNGCVEPEAVSRSLAPGTRDGTHHAFIKAEFDGHQGGLVSGPTVVFDLQPA